MYGYHEWKDRGTQSKALRVLEGLVRDINGLGSRHLVSMLRVPQFGLEVSGYIPAVATLHISLRQPLT